jgi:hypothetical protein
VAEIPDYEVLVYHWVLGSPAWAPLTANHGSSIVYLFDSHKISFIKILGIGGISATVISALNLIPLLIKRCVFSASSHQFWFWTRLGGLGDCVRAGLTV